MIIRDSMVISIYCCCFCIVRGAKEHEMESGKMVRELNGACVGGILLCTLIWCKTTKHEKFVIQTFGPLQYFPFFVLLRFSSWPFHSMLSNLEKYGFFFFYVSSVMADSTLRCKNCTSHFFSFSFLHIEVYVFWARK